MPSAIEIANLALDEVPHSQITALTDNTLAAEVCRRQLPVVLGEVLEAGEWSFGVRRVALAATTNDREDYWRYAYAHPADLAQPLRIIPATSSSLPADFLLPGQRLASTGVAGGPPIPFDFEGGLIWTDEPGAVLEYITTSPAYDQMSQRFVRLIALNLAARIATPLTKDPSRKRELLQEAELWGQRALAANLNANSTQSTYGEDFIPAALRGYFEARE